MARRFPEAGDRSQRARAAERGFGVVYFLVLVSVAALLLAGLSELGGLGLARSRLGAEHERARYLALAGAEHAVWRAYHETCFVEEQGNQEFTHSLGPDSYAYRVTGTRTHLNIAASGTAGRATHTLRRFLATPPLPLQAMVAYGLEAGGEPESRRYAMGTWGTPQATDEDVDNARWCVLRGCTQRRERLLATEDNSEDVYLQVWDGGSWTSKGLISDKAGSKRSFDIAYEPNSGRALIAYANNDDGDVHYRIWNGTTLSGDTRLDLPFSDKVRWIALAANPGTNEIALLAIGNKKLAAVIWNGSSFSAVNILDSNLYSDDYEIASVAFLRPSGTAVFIWNGKVLGISALRTAMWRGTWQAILFPTLAVDEARYVRLAPSPSSNRAQLGVLTKNQDLFTFSVSSTGSSLIANLFTTDAATSNHRCFDLAFLPSGDALMVFGRKDDDRLYSAAWNGTSGIWGIASVGADLQADDIETIQLRADPITGLVHAGVTTDNPDRLHLLGWSGAWTLPLVALRTPSSAPEPFMIAVEGDACGPGVIAIGP